MHVTNIIHTSFKLNVIPRKPLSIEFPRVIEMTEKEGKRLMTVERPGKVDALRATFATQNQIANDD